MVGGRAGTRSQYGVAERFRGPRSCPVENEAEDLEAKLHLPPEGPEAELLSILVWSPFPPKEFLLSPSKISLPWVSPWLRK